MNTEILACVVAASLLAACNNAPGSNACRVGADCASGVCLPDGTCGTSFNDAGFDTDASPSIDAPVSCTTLDGVITREEFPLSAGRMATFRVGVDAGVSSAGTMNPDGTRSWNFTGVMNGDRDVSYETKSVAGEWFASAFPTATFASRLNTNDTGVEALLGVYEATPTALRLLGVVSRHPGLDRTELTYTPPVEVIRFPLEQPMSWNEGTQISGYVTLPPSDLLPLGYQGYVVPYPAQYEIAVDASGTVETPGGMFPALRVRTLTTTTITVGLVEYVFTNRTHQFVSQCVGIVANLVSNEGEADVEFTTAAEAWRVGP
ncbi:MAG: hypothetical protein AB7P03_26865 [Kofleriaceae bacterium]